MGTRALWSHYAARRRADGAAERVRPSCPGRCETVTTLPNGARPRGPLSGGSTPLDMWPGAPYPLGASYDGGGTNFAIFSEVGERVELCLFDDEGKETRYDLPEREALVWHGYLPRIVPGQRYGYRVHGPYDPAAATGATRQAAARPVRQGDRRPDQLERGAVLLPVRRPRRVQRPRLGALHPALGGHQPVLRLGQRPAAADPVPRDRDLRGARAGDDDAPPRHPGRHPRHLHGPRAPRDDRPFQETGRHGRRTDAGAPVRARPRARRPRPEQLLGLQHHRLLRPAQRLRLVRHRGPAGPGVQVDGQAVPPRGHRGDSRRRLQPHRRGQPPGPDAVVPRDRQRRLLPARPQRPATTTTTPPAPGTASTSASTSRCG